VGIANALLVRRTPAGYEILDGHCRAEEAPDTEWPCLVVDLDDDEAAKLLATLDPVGTMAEADAQALATLLGTIHLEADALTGLVDALAAQAARILGEPLGRPRRVPIPEQAPRPSATPRPAPQAEPTQEPEPPPAPVLGRPMRCPNCGHEWRGDA
jgi:hypothetical protein